MLHGASHLNCPFARIGNFAETVNRIDFMLISGQKSSLISKQCSYDWNVYYQTELCILCREVNRSLGCNRSSPAVTG